MIGMIMLIMMKMITYTDSEDSVSNNDHDHGTVIMTMIIVVRIMKYYLHKDQRRIVKNKTIRFIGRNSNKTKQRNLQTKISTKHTC